MPIGWARETKERSAKTNRARAWTTGKRERVGHAGGVIKGSVRKEVIQPQVLLQLPCYDFTPIMDHTVDASFPEGLGRRLLVQPTFVM